jgi:hypothetical protein
MGLRKQNGFRSDYNLAANGGHGRVEVRKVWYSENVQWIKDCQQWQGLSSLAAVESQRTIGDKISTESQVWHQNKTTQSRLGRKISAKNTGNLDVVALDSE